MKIQKIATIQNNNFEDFKSTILNKLTDDESRWFYFIEQDDPFKSCLFKIEDISYFELKQQNSFTSNEEKIKLTEEAQENNMGY